MENDYKMFSRFRQDFDRGPADGRLDDLREAVYRRPGRPIRALGILAGVVGVRHHQEGGQPAPLGTDRRAGQCRACNFRSPRRVGKPLPIHCAVPIIRLNCQS